MPEISVSNSPDAMKAFLYVASATGGQFPSESELRHALTEHGVAFGIIAETIQTMVEQKKWDAYVEVANGQLPLPGIPGKFEFLLDVTQKGKPKKLADGRVDHHDISFIVNVTKGALLLKHIPALAGKPGRTVFNKPIDPPPVEDRTLIAGRGTALSANDRHVLLADINGALLLHANGCVDVVDSKEVSGNVDYSTGNIRFSGNLKITGTVRSGFTVESDGDCHIGGNVEDASVTSLQDIDIAGGAIGAAKANIKCGGSLKVKHVANVAIQAGEDIDIVEDALHCAISAEGNITAKAIVGGSVSAWKRIETEAIGAEGEPKTIVDLGGRAILMQKKDALLKELASLTSQIGSQSEMIFMLVRDEMDARGKLLTGSLNRLFSMKEALRLLKVKGASVQTEIETVDEKLKANPVPSLKAKTVYPNTIIKFGSYEKLIKEKLLHAFITVDFDKIIIGKY